MSNQLSPRVRQMRDALRAERLRKEQESGARGNTDNSAWLATKENDIQPQVEGITTGAGAPRPAPDNSDPWSEPDALGPRADSQAAAGAGLHAVLENAGSDDGMLEEALELSLQQTRNESGPQAERTRQAAHQLASQIKDKRISDIAAEFVARSEQETGTAYCADDDGENYLAVLQELNRQHRAGVYVDEDDTEKAAAAFFARGIWTVANLLRAWATLVKEGRAPVLYEGQRPISDAERRAAAVRGASGDVLGGILSLLQVAIPSIGNAASTEELLAIIADPANREVLLDATISVWGATADALSQGFRDTPEMRAAISEALGTAPPTLDNIRAAFSQVRRSRAPRTLEEQHAAAINRPPSVDDLESMGDQEISDLLSSVVRDRTRRVRRGLL